MMSKRAKSFSLFAAVAGAIAIGSAACSGGGGGGSSSPTPTVAATPNVCLVVFESDVDTSGAPSTDHANLYVIEMPAALWTNGTVTLALASGDPSVDAVYARLLYGGAFSGASPVYPVAGITTAGSFTLGGIPATGGTAI